MAETSRFLLPLLEAAQAQKHVTVNEALSRLDGLMQLRLASLGVNTPPVSAAEGAAYGVGPAPVNEWAGQAGAVALRVNGGWVFVPATLGMRAYVEDEGGLALHDGTGWNMGLQTLSAHGAGMVLRVAEIDHAVTLGPSSAVPGALPAQAVVYGVTGRVTSAITGTATGFSLGVAGSADRYGAGLSLGAGSWLRGLTGSPLTYYAAEDLILTAEGGDFAGGAIRLAVHYAQFTLPG